MEESNSRYNDEDSHFYSVQRFEEMLSKNESFYLDVDEFEELVDYYLDKNDPKLALKVLEFALEQHPMTSSLMVNKAQVFVSMHKPNQALKLLNQAEAIEPYNIDLYQTKASIYSQLRQ